jgi:hypothetical protein
VPWVRDLGIQGVGFGAWCLRFRVRGIGFGVRGHMFGGLGLERRAWGLGFFSG